MSSRARWIVGSVVLTAAATYAFLGDPLDPFDNRRFSPEAWREAGARFDRDARARMCRDIIKRVVRPGTPEKQVVALLGPPERIRNRRGPGGDPLPGRRIYEYSIGSWTLQRMDDAFLYVHIDASDQVVMAEIYGY
jgi:hypothetical protein